MDKLGETGHTKSPSAAVVLPVSVIIAARNEAKNLPRCLETLRGVGEVYVIDSQGAQTGPALHARLIRAR
jgi:hypothetical protein